MIKNRRVVQVTVFQKYLIMFVFTICGDSFIVVVLQAFEFIPANIMVIHLEWDHSHV